MAETLLLTGGFIAALFVTVSYVYFLEKQGKQPSENILYRTGAFIEDLWFNHGLDKDDQQ